MGKSDLSEYKTIEELKQEILILKRENHAYMLTVDKLLKDANIKAEKIQHLESLVAQNVPVIKKENNKVSLSTSSEEEIAVQQLERLRQASQNRVLTLEEVRTYDLLVKNKRLSTNESTVNLGKNQYREVAEADLLQIAAKAPSESDKD